MVVVVMWLYTAAVVVIVYREAHKEEEVQEPRVALLLDIFLSYVLIYSRSTLDLSLTFRTLTF